MLLSFYYFVFEYVYLWSVQYCVKDGTDLEMVQEDSSHEESTCQSNEFEQ